MLPFPQSEYERRWQAVQDECTRGGLAGVVVVSRGGAQTDSYADVLYLANHYNVFPLLADRPPHWSGHSHCAFVIGQEGEPTLIDSFGEYRSDLVAVDDARVSADLPAGIAQALADKGLIGEVIGLVAGNAMLLGAADRLRELAERTVFVSCDGLVESIRARKSSTELDRLRESAAAGELIMRRIMDRAVAGGCTEADAVADGVALAASRGVAMYDAAVASGPHASRYTYGRLPSWSTRQLEDGDLFHIDLYGTLDGYMFDFSRSAVVGRNPDRAQVDVMDGASAAIDAGVAALKPGVTGAEIFGIVRGELAARGLADAPVDDDADQSSGFAGYACHGHGLGLWWEPPWITPWETQTVEANMMMAVECMAGTPEVGLVKLEQNAIVGESETQSILTLPALVTAESTQPG